MFTARNLKPYDHAAVIVFDYTLEERGRLVGYSEEGPSQYVSTIKVISLFILCRTPTR